MTLEEIEQRIKELQKERDQLLAELNFRLGAIQELERIKAELQKPKE